MIVFDGRVGILIEGEILMRLKGIQHKAAQIMQEKIDEYGLRYGQLHLMMLVEKHPNESQKFLAKEMRFTQGAMSSMVKRLIKLNMLEQIPLEEDMRYNRLVITEKGQSMIRDYQDELYGKYKDMCLGFSGDELKDLNGYLTRFDKNLDSINKSNNVQNLEV